MKERYVLNKFSIAPFCVALFMVGLMIPRPVDGVEAAEIVIKAEPIPVISEVPEPEPELVCEEAPVLVDVVELFADDVAERLEHEALLAQYFTDKDVVMMAQLIDIEAGGVFPLCHRAAVGWTVTNRLDSGLYNQSTIGGIISQEGQYAWYSGRSYADINYEIALDVLTRWAEEQISGEEDLARVLPKEFMSFYGDGEQNYFYDREGNFWNFYVEYDQYEDWIY